MTKLWWQWRFIIGAWLFEYLFTFTLNLTSINSPVGIDIFFWETLPLYSLIWKVWIFISFDWITVYFCLRLNISFVMVRAASFASGPCLCRSPDWVWRADRFSLTKLGVLEADLERPLPPLAILLVCQPKYTDRRPALKDRSLRGYPSFLPCIKIWPLL